MAMSFGQQPFVTTPVSQRLPDQMAYKDSLETASVVAGRQHGVKYTATNGGPYEVGSGQSEIAIPLSANGYIDLQTACLSYEVKLGGNLTSAETNNPVLENGPLAPFSEISLDVGGVQVSRIRDCSSVYNINAYASTIQSHDNSEGTLENAWATSQKATIANDANQTLTNKIATLQDATTITSLLDGTASKAGYVGSNNGVGATDEDLSYRNPDRNGIKKVVVPLSKLIPFFQMDSYFPLSAVGNMTLRLRIHSKLESVVVCQQGADQATQSLISGASVTLNDVAVFSDIVVPESAYKSAMNQLLGSATGLQMAYTDHEVQVRDFAGTSDVSSYALNFIVGGRYVTNMKTVFRHTASLNSPNQCSTFSFGSQGFQQARLQLGSLSVPTTDPLHSIEDAYYTLLKSNNMQGNPDYGNAISLKEYCADIYRTGATEQDPEDLIISPSKFILGFSLEQVLQANPDILQGVNTLQNNSVIQLVVDLKGSAKIFGGFEGDTPEVADTNCFATAVFTMIKVLAIKMNAVSVESR